MQPCMFLCLPLTLQEKPIESWTGYDQAFLCVPLLSPYGNNENRVAAPMLYKSDAFYFTFFWFHPSFLISPIYDEHTWSAEGALETGCGCGSRVSTSGHCSATNIVWMSIYFSSKHSIKKKENPQSKWWVFFPSERLSCQARHQKYSWKMLSTEIIY